LGAVNALKRFRQTPTCVDVRARHPNDSGVRTIRRMITDSPIDPSLPADAGGSQSPTVPAQLREMDCALLVRAQEMVQVGTWVATPNLTTPNSFDVIWSNEMFRLAGLEPQSFTPTFETFLQSVHPDDRARVSAAIGRALESRSPYLFDYRVNLKDGSLKVLAARANLELNESGDVVRILGTCADITPRYLAEQALADNEGRLRAVFDQSAVGMLVASREGVLLKVNKSFADMLGYDVADMEGQSGLKFVHPGDRIRAETQRRTLAADAAVVFDRRYLARNGSTVWGKVTVSRIQLKEAADAFMAVVEDVTNQRRADEELRRQTEILRGMLDHLPVMVLRLDISGHLIYANCEAQRLFGWPKEEMPSDIIAAAFPDATQADHVRQLLAAGTAEWLDLEPRAADGRIVPSSWAALGLSDGQSLVIGQDLTERRQLQQNLAQSQKLEAIGQLAGGVAHDFNNLLTVISAGATFVQDAAEDNPEIVADAQDILNACARAAALTRQLLAFSRRQMLQPEVLNLNEVVQSLSKTLHRLLGEQIQLEVSCDAERFSVEVDRHQIEQVVLNLAVNARDAIKDHGTISISTRNTTDSLGRSQLQLQVRDDGCGIEPAVMRRMYEPFYTTKPVGKGTGLGLATVHGIIEQSGGRIAVESTVGKGTTFTVTLPCATSVSVPARAKLDMTAGGGKETILLVEDENAVRAITRRMLTILGYTVIEARHGRDALLLAADMNLHIDLLVTDVIMPEMGGRELATTLREQRPGLPVLYVSGYTDDELLRRGILEPGVRLMRKPFTKNDLARVVRGLINGTAASRADVIGGGAGLEAESAA
jgi:two-component system cell cycle sensor histidine kinase/response regulator CckA